ncbi:MAG: MiaB/RimO family radical SAM methylthiotransferase [Chloroflexi bacterium]|nr:MiaB/RimO family radical SAM methylthiotransferase [Chloroflexota bacterium]
MRHLPVLDVISAPTAAPERAAIPRLAPIPDAQVAEFATEDTVLPRFHVWTLGCQMNRSDSEEMAGALLASGCSEATGMDDADLIVINSCAIREAAEQKIIGRMGVLARLKAANPALRIVLTGCSVRADETVDMPRRYPQVDLFLRPDEEPELTARLGLAGFTTPGGLSGPSFARVGRGTAATADRLPGSRAAAVATETVARSSAISAWLPIIYGCDKTCTYCIVPFSRGPERSRPFDQIVEEARSLAAAGYQEVTLLGQNVNSYGHDLPPEARFAEVVEQRRLGRDLDLQGRPDMAALLRAIDGIRTVDGVPAISRLRFVTSHPWDLTDRLIAAMADCPSVCEHLHLPVQSGDDGVLRRMGRQYTADAYLSLVERLRSSIPGISLSTDVICGFSGESEAAFENTLALLERVGFDQVFAAAFSVRPGTPAARLLDDVPPAEKRARLNRLLDLQERISTARNAAWLGRTTEVLFDGVREEKSHGHASGQGPAGTSSTETPGSRLTGRNREHRLVHLTGSPDLVGRRVAVTIERTGPYALAGSIAV